jgi:hypothetical protein
VSGTLPILMVEFLLASPVIPAQSEVTVNPHFVSTIYPSPCVRPEHKACANIIMGNGDKVFVIGTVGEVTKKIRFGG